MQSLLKLTHTFLKEQIPFQCGFIANESLVTRARNSIAHQFMESGCDYLLFIDADIEFEPKDILSMIKADVPIIGGNYSLKDIDWKKVQKLTEEGYSPWQVNHCSGHMVIRPKLSDKEQQVKSNAPFPVVYLGTGFMLIKREVFKAFEKSYQKNWAWAPRTKIGKGPKHFIYFDTKINHEGIYLSEDYYFCEWAQELGFEIMLAPWVHLKHWGIRQFESCFFCSQGAVIHEERKQNAKG